MIAVFNPSRFDFHCYYDSKPLPLAKSLEVTRYELDYIGEHVKKHLVDFIMNERGISSINKFRRNKITIELSR